MGKLFITGIGPGGTEDMTIRAFRALESSDTIVGYTTYLDLVKNTFPDKRYLSTPMRQETERCRMALKEAQAGHTVSMICSGDAGIYGMAGPVLSLAAEYGNVGIEMIPGVTAAVSGAAVLGAPLMNDFCVISLSDQLTPWSVIEKRLRAAAAGDLVIALYNPKSKSRPDNLANACRILTDAGIPGSRPCGLAGRTGREGAWQRICALEDLPSENADMFTTIFIGCSMTQVINGRLITRRGYKADL